MSVGFAANAIPFEPQSKYRNRTVRSISLYVQLMQVSIPRIASGADRADGHPRARKRAAQLISMRRSGQMTRLKSGILLEL